MRPARKSGLNFLVMLTYVNASLAQNGTFTPVGSVVNYDAGFRCAVPFWRTTDLNLDNRRDIVLGMTPTTTFTSVSTPGELTIWTGQQDGTLRESTASMFSGKITAAYNFTQVNVADFNGDGRPDIFVADSGVDTYANGVPVGPWLGSTPKLALSSGSTLVDTSATLSNLPSVFLHTSTLADINGDGFVDVYAGSISAGTNNTPYLLINDGHGNFTRNQSRLPTIVTVSGSTGTVTQPDGSKIGAGEAFTGSLFMDYNNDKAPDLVLMPQNAAPNGLLLTNDGTGDFSKIAPINLPAGLYGGGYVKYVTNSDGSTAISQGKGTVGLDTQAVDLNNDGYLDLVAIETVVDPANNVYYKGGKLQILINQQGKGFVDETASRGAPGFDATINYDSYHGTLTVFDINGDGAPDLIAVRVAPTFYEYHVFLNDGSGHFTRATLAGLPQQGFIVPLSTKPDEPVRVAAFNTVNKKLVQTAGGSVSSCTLSEQVYQSSVIPIQHVNKSRDECLFTWGELHYPAYVAPAGSQTTSAAAYNYRYYTQSHSYLGTSSADNHLYYMGPLTNNVLKDLGLAYDWYVSAGCS